MKPGADTASAEIITTARLGSHAPKISRNAKTFVGMTIPEISRPAPNTNPDNKDATISMILASEDMTGYCDGYNRCQHKDDGRSDGTNRQPSHATDAVAGGTAASQSGAETDQQAGRDDDGPACRQFGWWHPIAHPACTQRRHNEPGGNRDAGGVVDEGEEQVLPDVAHRCLREPPRTNDANQIAFQEGDAGTLHRDVGAGPHGDADVGCGKRRGVVDAVPGHRDDPPGLLQLDDHGNLLIRKHFCLDI